MSIFGKIKDAIFGRAEAATPAATSAAATQAAMDAISTINTEAQAQAAAQPQEVDVDAMLTEMGQGKNLNWRSSIVDLMKLVGMESSLAERKELAMELGYTGDLDGSAEMNIWLHKAVMRELAANGGKVPAELMD
ncbi:MAG: DUF3597 domain-containing protein [Sphingorhabdus sp.]